MQAQNKLAQLSEVLNEQAATLQRWDPQLHPIVALFPLTVMLILIILYIKSHFDPNSSAFVCCLFLLFHLLLLTSVRSSSSP